MIEKDFKFFTYIETKEQKELNEIQQAVKQVELHLKQKMKAQLKMTKSVKVTVANSQQTMKEFKQK